MDEIDDCPFCGDQGFLICLETPTNPNKDRYIVSCDKGCEASTAVLPLAKVILAWNARHRTDDSARIAALEEENARLREALAPFAREARRMRLTEEQDVYAFTNSGLSYGDLRRATTALGEQP